MKLKNTLWLLIFTLLLAGGYFFAKKWMPATKEIQEKQRHLIDIKAGDVTEVGIKGIDRDFLFERKDQQWKLTKPLQVRANALEIEGILSNLEFLERRRTLSNKDIAEAKLSSSDYGLDKPRMVAYFKTKDKTISIQIGNEAKQGDNLYVQLLGDSNIYLVDKNLANRLGKKLEDYREKSLFDFSESQVCHLELKNGNKLLEFSKTNHLWRIVQPLSARADSMKVDELLKQTTSLRADDFLSEEPTASKEYGLEVPLQEVRLTLEKQDAVNVLLLGPKLKSDDKKMEKAPEKIAAKIKGQNSIVSIPSAYSSQVGKSLNDFRDHQVSRHDNNNITEIELKNRQLVIAVQKQGNTWKITQPEKMDADRDLVERFLAQLNSIQIKEFVADVVTDLDKFGLKSPHSTVVLRGQPSNGTNTNLTVYLDLAIGKDDSAKKLVYAKVADESSVYGLDLADVSDFPKSALDLRSRVLFEIKKDRLKSCTQKKGKTSVTLDRVDGKWKLAENTQGILDETAWQKFLNRLERFDVEKIMGTALNATIKQYGLESPVATWTVTYEIDGKPMTEEVLVGREIPQKKYYILWKNQLLLCEISKEAYQMFLSDWVKAVAK